MLEAAAGLARARAAFEFANAIGGLIAWNFHKWTMLMLSAIWSSGAQQCRV